MAWIEVIDEKDASDKLKRIYDDIVKKRGKISNIMKIQSQNQDAMIKHLDLYLSIMFGSSNLSREDRESIAVIVSSVNKCNYCINHHKEALNHYWKNTNKLQRFIDDYKSVNLSNKTKIMLNYVVKLTKNPYEVKEKDIKILREVGFLEKDILDINLITSYFNFVNRIALGLGVKFTKEEVTGYNY
jgi:uncharacterized peroxidase-related enzyme